MLLDARQVAPGSTLTADVCIIGAGAAGITLARALAGSGHTVVLLESGGFTPDARVIAATRREPEYGKPVGLYVESIASKSRIASIKPSFTSDSKPKKSLPP